MTNSMQENEEEKEYVDVKFLLKQVYAAHISKIKELQLEVTKLKEELKAKENSSNDCPKCKEMESAYSACKEEYKNAVLEQTKKFKQLEQKYFAIDRKSESCSSGNKNNEVNTTVSSNVPGTLESIPESLKFTESDVMRIDESVNAEKPLRYYTDNVASDIIENIAQEPLNVEKLCNEKKNSRHFILPADSKSGGESLDNSIVILVPETVDIVPNTASADRWTKKKTSSPKSKNPLGKENHNKNDRSSSKKTSPTKSSTSRKRVFSEQIISSDPNECEEAVFKQISEIKQITDHLEINPLPTALNAKRKKFQKQKGWSENFKDFGSPKKSDTPDLSADKSKQLTNVIDDDDDFQTTYLPSEDAVASSKPKSMPKKAPNLKPIKSTSRYKMSFEANNIIKRTNYKQTKISASVFQRKRNNASQSSDSVDSCDNVCNTELTDKNNESSLVGLSELASLVDQASTYKEIANNRTVIPKEVTDDDAIICSPIKTSFLEKTKNSSCKNYEARNNKEKETEVDESISNEDLLTKEDNKKAGTKSNLLDSFDRVPVVNEEPNYKYKEDAVRNKQKRKQLKGFECKECTKYYNELGLTESEKKERMNQCSRHRGKYAPPPTPEHFWELDFPDTEECKLRGYIGDTQKVELKQRRRRPLNID